MSSLNTINEEFSYSCHMRTHGWDNAKYSFDLRHHSCLVVKSLIFDYVKVTPSAGVHGIVGVKPLSHGGN
ncbi:hypothetical protein EV2_038949 [Malus domestica]